jgi:hypothetical protein
MRHFKRMASDVGMQLFAQLLMARYSEILLSKGKYFHFFFGHGSHNHRDETNKPERRPGVDKVIKS